MNLILAISENNVIGNDLDIPWDLKTDRAFFREKVKDKTVILYISFFKMERLARVISTSFASSVRPFFCFAISTSKLILIAMGTS